MTPTTKLSAVALALLALGAPAWHELQSSSAATPQRTFSREQLEQMVAPIALHPDPLLSQILSAATYPIEVVQAQRWVDRHSDLAGSALEDALKPQTWDPSVKALCGFPTVLKQMSDDLDWTRDLGEAFLGQKAELMDTVQTMRKKALDAGNLKTTPQQKVVQDDGAIDIEPTSPDVVYVPAYSPMVVYGAGWYYPFWYYPYWYYPPPYGGGYVTFGVGFWWGSACWSHCDWHHHGVIVDDVAFRDFSARTSSTPAPGRFVGGATGRFEWQHDPAHERGVTPFAPRPAAPRFREGSGAGRFVPPHRPSKHGDLRRR